MTGLHRPVYQRVLETPGLRLERDPVAQDCRPEGALALGGDGPAAHLAVLQLGPGQGQAGGGRVVAPLDSPHVGPGLQLDHRQVRHLAGGGGVVPGVHDDVLDLLSRTLKPLTRTETLT